MSFVLFGFPGLAAGLPATAALVTYGAGNGLWSIARGAVPLAIWGPADYPRLIGRLAAPALIASAAAPALGAWLIATIRPQGTLQVLAASTLLPVAGIALLHATCARDATLQPDCSEYER